MTALLLRPRAGSGNVPGIYSALHIVGGVAVGLTLIGARNRRARHSAEIGGLILILAVAVGISIFALWLGLPVTDHHLDTY